VETKITPFLYLPPAILEILRPLAREEFLRKFYSPITRQTKQNLIAYEDSLGKENPM
jgi:hypothetical protein